MLGVSWALLWGLSTQKQDHTIDMLEGASAALRHSRHIADGLGPEVARYPLAVRGPVVFGDRSAAPVWVVEGADDSGENSLSIVWDQTGEGFLELTQHRSRRRPAEIMAHPVLTGPNRALFWLRRTGVLAGAEGPTRLEEVNKVADLVTYQVAWPHRTARIAMRLTTGDIARLRVTPVEGRGIRLAPAAFLQDASPIPP